MKNKELFNKVTTAAAVANGMHPVLSSTGMRTMYVADDNENLGFRLRIGGLEANHPTGKYLSEDKTLCSYVLNKAGVPAIEHWNLDIDTYHDLVRNGTEKKLILKPRYGLGGKGVSVIHNVLDVERITLAQVESGNWCLSEFLDADIEYRVSVVDGEVKYIYGKQRNPETMQHNLSMGATICYPSEDIKPALTEIALKAMEVVGLDIANIDILHAGDVMTIMEVNATITLSGILDAFPEKEEEVTEVYKAMFAVGRRNAEARLAKA